MAVLCRLSYSSGDGTMIDAAKHTRPAMLALAFLLAGACSTHPSPLSDLPTGTLTIGGGAVRVDVWIAEESATRVEGLRGVEEMAENRGMVFLHQEPTGSRFTMQDTLIPLSLAAWGPDQRIASIIDMDPCAEEPCPIYDPEVTWVGALEVNQGFFARNGVEVGDRVALER